MAECPKCKQVWLWDWCQDTLHKPDGQHVCTQSSTFRFDDNDRWIVTAMICDCTHVLGFQNLDQFGLEMHWNQEWRNVDWELLEHAYDRQEAIDRRHKP